MTHPQPSPIVDEVALPVGCKMHSHSRYASDLDCTKCGLREGDACREYFAISDARIAAKKDAAALVSPPKAGEGEPVAWRWKAHGHEAGPWIVVHDKGTAEAAMSLFASKGKHQSVQPLYATQQPRVDGVRVTDEMVARVTAAVKRYTQATLFVDELREIVRSALAFHAPAIGETQPGLSATDETRAGSLEQGETAP